jgi:leucyl-tRNA synthetase
MSENHTPISRARQLRKNMTPEEKLLWKNLRNRKFFGLKFLRQHPIVYDTINNKPLFFVPDFYCAEKRTIIEIDGKIHDFQKEYDKRRQ